MLLSASITNPSSQEGASPPGLAGEMMRGMKEAGVLKGLTNALKLVDNNHPQVSISTSKVLEMTLTPQTHCLQQLTVSYAIAGSLSSFIFPCQEIFCWRPVATPSCTVRQTSPEQLAPN